MDMNPVFRALGAAALLTSCAHSVPDNRPAALSPLHAFSCQGFTKHADGSWWAGPNTLAFNLGSSTDIMIRNAGPITNRFAVFATGDNLFDVIENHCGATAKDGSSTKPQTVNGN